MFSSAAGLRGTRNCPPAVTPAGTITSPDSKYMKQNHLLYHRKEEERLKNLLKEGGLRLNKSLFLRGLG